MIEVIKWGLIIGSLIFCSIQIGNIASSVKNIDRTLMVWSMRNLMPELFDDMKREMEEKGE